MKKRVFSLLMVLVLIIGTLTACSTSKTGSSNDSAATTSTGDTKTAATTSGKEETIKIAVAAPMTGDNSEYGIGFANAAELMAKKWNDKGGCLGRTVEIVKYDDKNSPEEATTIAQKIVSDNTISGVIGHFASGVCMVAAPIYQENKMIEISPSSSHADYSGIGDYIFRNNTVIAKEGAASVDIAINDMGKKNIGIIAIKTDWGTNTAAVIQDIIAGLDDSSINIVDYEEVVEGSDDYSATITNFVNAGAEVIICCGMYNLVAPFTKQYRAVDPSISIVGFSNSYSQQLLELGGDSVEGVCFPVIFFSESEDSSVKSYVDEFTAAYGSAPSALTSQAYDSVGMLLTAIEAAGTTDSEKVKEELYKVNYPGVTGQTQFDSIGDVDKEFVKVTIKDGKFTKMN